MVAKLLLAAIVMAYLAKQMTSDGAAAPQTQSGGGIGDAERRRGDTPDHVRCSTPG